MIIYYFCDCPTCKNHRLWALRELAASERVRIIERYIWVLPDVWGEEAKKISKRFNVELPFLYDTDRNTPLGIPEKINLDEVKDFLGIG